MRSKEQKSGIFLTACPWIWSGNAMTSESTSGKSREIASLLVKKMNIPNDATLVRLLGNGDETCNLDAMTTLVNSYAHEIDQDEVIARLIEAVQ